MEETDTDDGRKSLKSILSKKSVKSIKSIPENENDFAQSYIPKRNNTFETYFFFDKSDQAFRMRPIQHTEKRPSISQEKIKTINSKMKNDIVKQQAKSNHKNLDEPRSKEKQSIEKILEDPPRITRRTIAVATESFGEPKKSKTVLTRDQIPLMIKKYKMQKKSLLPKRRKLSSVYTMPEQNSFMANEKFKTPSRDRRDPENVYRSDSGGSIIYKDEGVVKLQDCMFKESEILFKQPYNNTKNKIEHISNKKLYKMHNEQLIHCVDSTPSRITNEISTQYKVPEHRVENKSIQSQQEVHQKHQEVNTESDYLDNVSCYTACEKTSKESLSSSANTVYTTPKLPVPHRKKLISKLEREKSRHILANFVPSNVRNQVIKEESSSEDISFNSVPATITDFSTTSYPNTSPSSNSTSHKHTVFIKAVESLHSDVYGRGKTGYLSTIKPTCGCPEINVFVPCTCHLKKPLKSRIPRLERNNQAKRYRSRLPQRIYPKSNLSLSDNSADNGGCL